MAAKKKTRRDDRPPRLADVDLGAKLPRADYNEQLDHLQLELRKIQQAYLRTRDRAIIVFEGWDAAGKGGTIRRISEVMDPKTLKVWPIAAPTRREQGTHWLYRFWQRLPEPGSVAIFDRSWYGRVLVERIDGLATEAEWRRAYDEIVDFERLLTADGVRMIKIFLHVSADKQRERFEDRIRNPIKRWKLSLEDFHNRQNRAAYEAALNEAFARTSTAAAPWRVVPSESKKFGRVAAIRHIVDALGRNVDTTPPPLDPEIARAAREVLGIEADDG
ncbi:MAG: polyphosphate kinase [Alphaproteobacteria bacterium]|jgi:polyphosphate kinase 2 (PPK2 family)|nr:polyphosphate kinase [Alphaproteobacteria bacterium]